MQVLALIAGYIVVTFVGALAFIVLLRIFQGKIDLRFLVSEKEGGAASLSRFQFLIFTFVVSVCTMVLTIESGEFPHLGPEILGLLGISGGSYLISKGIKESGMATRGVSGSTTAVKPPPPAQG
jgi:hypothetical protein